MRINASLVIAAVKNACTVWDRSNCLFPHPSVSKRALPRPTQNPIASRVISCPQPIPATIYIWRSYHCGYHHKSFHFAEPWRSSSEIIALTMIGGAINMITDFYDKGRAAVRTHPFRGRKSLYNLIYSLLADAEFLANINKGNSAIC